MNYPVWDVPVLGSGLVVAIIAIIHVLISHLAIGGGAFLFVAEMWSDRHPSGTRVREFLHKFATFFLVYTTVFGAMTGVGIWFSIQLASPEGTSLLIHQYAFAWATEWVSFLAELTVLYLYYYGWRTNSRRMQVLLAGAYFVIAWFSLVIINGILTFMLTPGDWTLANMDLVAGFFNPGYAPSLVIRTLVMFTIAGLAAILVASRLGDEDPLKADIVRFSAKWVIPAAALAPLFLIWYWHILPQPTVKLVQEGVVGIAGGKLEIITRHFVLACTAAGLIVLGTFALALRPRATTTAAALALLLIAQLGIMGGEFFREMARKPYVIHGTLFSNSLWQKDATPENLARPFLERAQWHPAVEPGSLPHGEWVYRLQCVNCHTRDGYRGLQSRTASWTGAFGYQWLGQLDAQGVMPPFQGTPEDRAALAAYLVSWQGVQTSGSQLLAEIRGAEAAEAAKKAQLAAPPPPSPPAEAAPTLPVEPSAAPTPLAPGEQPRTPPPLGPGEQPPTPPTLEPGKQSPTPPPLGPGEQPPTTHTPVLHVPAPTPLQPQKPPLPPAAAPPLPPPTPGQPVLAPMPTMSGPGQPGSTGTEVTR